MTYQSEALAQKLASRLQDADYKDCGDASFRVVQVGESPFAPPRCS